MPAWESEHSHWCYGLPITFTLLGGSGRGACLGKQHLTRGDSDHGERAQVPLSYLDMARCLEAHSPCHFEDNQMCSALRKEVLMGIFSHLGWTLSLGTVFGHTGVAVCQRFEGRCVGTLLWNTSQCSPPWCWNCGMQEAVCSSHACWAAVLLSLMR